MNHIEKVLLRMGIEELEVLVNPVVYELISLYENNPNKRSIISMIIKTNDLSLFFSDKIKRELLFDFLNEDEANDLICTLKIVAQDNPWESLKKQKYNSSKIEILNDYFGIEASITEKEKVDVKSSEFSIDPCYPLFHHQEAAAMKVLSVLDKNNRVLLHMPTGSGKTRTSMNIVCQYFRKSLIKGGKQIVLWFADTEELCDQAIEEFTKAWGNLGSCLINAYRFYGEYNQDLSTIEQGFVVCGIQKMLAYLAENQEKVYNFSNGVSLLFFDEAHKIIAPTYKHIVDLFTLTLKDKTKLVGLTATPGRSILDNSENERLADFFNYKKVTLSIEGYDNPVEFLQEEEYLSEVEYLDLPYEQDRISLTEREINYIADGKDISSRILNELGLDSKRNLIILNAVVDEIKRKSSIIVFACSVENAIAIHSLLLYKGLRSGIVISKQDKDERRLTIEEYRSGAIDVIVNYGVLTTGFDVPRTNVAIIGRPTMSLTLYSQMVGRAIRGPRAGGNKKSKIYTVVDNIIPAFRSVVRSFDHWDDVWE